jgi:serine/threonine protein kinase
VSDPKQTRRPRQVGPYRLLRQIGVGAMGEIYLVQHAETKERFALKRIRGDFADDEELIRFRREAELVARLYHPHVVRLRDSNFATAQPYQVYELYEGGTLEDRIKRAGALPLEQALEIASKLGQALSHAHSQGVLHRDLKPENVLFDSVGEPALADFGLARRTVSKGNSLTATGEAIGTPLYMAPEQALDSKRVDERADLYGLAAITYAMLSGGPPVVGARTVLEAFDKVINEAPPPLEREDLPPRVERALFAALAKSPEERPPSVAAWLEQIDLTPGSEVPARRALLVALPLLVLLGVLGLWASGLGRAPSPTPSPQASKVTGSGPADPEPVPSPTGPPLHALGAVGSADLKRLVPRRRGWAWLTLRDRSQEAGVSLLISCTWELDELRVVIPRGRGVEDGQIWDTLWEPTQKHLKGLATGTMFWNFSRRGDLLEAAQLSDETFSDVAGGALARCLEQGAAGALFRLLAQQEPDEKTWVRRATWNQDEYTWEPLLWGEWVDGGPGGGDIDLRVQPAYLAGLFKNLDLTEKDLGSSLKPKNWPGALTHNRCRNLEGKFFPENGHFALPHGHPTHLEVRGSVNLEGRRPVFSRRGGAIVGHSPPEATRYLVFGQEPGWLLIGWGGGLAWTRADSFSQESGPLYRYTTLLGQGAEHFMNVRVKPHFPGRDWGGRLGPSPTLGQIPLRRFYPFLGVVGGPPDDVKVKRPVHQINEISAAPDPDERLLSRRWVKIQFDDRVAWVAWWANQSVTTRGNEVTTRPTLGEFVYPE